MAEKPNELPAGVAIAIDPNTRQTSDDDDDQHGQAIEEMKIILPLAHQVYIPLLVHCHTDLALCTELHLNNAYHSYRPTVC
jgi:hypothetical protein